MNANFKFKTTDDGFDVLYRGKRIGAICPAKEVSGRHCFYLACDTRREPRTYRGKIKAAEALQTIHKLVSESKKKRWSAEELIVMAWDERPRASEAP